MYKIKRRIFEIIEKGNDGDFVDYFILSLILINSISMFLLTFPINESFERVLNYIDTFTVIIFTIEYLLRVWTAEFLYPNKTKFKATIKYLFSFMAIIDLLAILPFYLPFITSVNLTVLRTLRFTRVFRLLKLNRYTEALNSVGKVIKNKAAELLSSIFVVIILMIISSVLMYSVESPEQPEIFKNGLSGLWWAVATFTTVGYGDIYPVTGIGRLLSAIIAILGIGLVAVPTGIISSGFIEQNQKNNDSFDLENKDLETELNQLRKQIDLIEQLIKNREI